MTMRPQALFGGLLVALGGIFLLDALDVLQAGDVIRGWWPIVIVAVGVARLLSRPPDRLGGGITLGVGLVLLGFTLDLIDGSVLAMAWPLLLIGIGAYLVVGRQRTRDVRDGDDQLSSLVLLSGRELTPTSQAFRGGSLVAVLGGIDVDLRHARLAEDAHLDITTVLGGVDLKVPAGWRIEVTGPAILGGTENGAAGQVLPPDAPTLHLRTMTVLGGVDVKVVPSPVAPPV
jgi:hypothetical protein